VRERDQLEDLDLGGRILKCNLNMLGWRGLDLSGCSEGEVACCCEHGNKHLGSMECGKRFD
jgi:hypothetical protein